ncbi:GNAT family N-acetyltransferase [Streptococcus minor]|uniref:GNAT family N-acetyltransferase n=1 Tax=Streptococcus minor TaxID=229549 RepID=UPI00037438A6|nr:GNAT family N-acetyltransferase [Streptococcus minor]
MDIRTLELSDQDAFEQFQALLLTEKDMGNRFIQSKKVHDFPSFVKKSRQLEKVTDNPNWSTVTSYYGFINGEIAGKISCRWQLEKGDLARVGGHIGYITSPKFRRQGIMTSLLHFAFEQYQDKGIESVLITAHADNLPSRKTIEKVGGQLETIIRLEDDFPDPRMAGQKLARYWVQL